MEQFLQNTLQNSQDAFQKWKKIPFEERQKYFTQLSEILNNRKQEFATIITQEMNKPISQSVSEIKPTLDFEKVTLPTAFLVNSAWL